MDAARTRAIAERKAAAPPARRAGEQRHAAAGPCPGDARRIAGKAAGADMEFRRAEAAARRADADGAAQGVGRSGRQEARSRIGGETICIGGGEPGSAPEFVAACHIYSPTLGTFQKAFGPQRAEIVADVANYTDN